VLTVGSLFSGIGGLDLGLERAGMEVIWQSEIDPYACKVLSKHWPKVPNHGNIKDINWRHIVRPDIVCGGYPCQPFSTAGKRNGTDDPRHLWPWVGQAISQLRPKYAILENVRGHITLGLSTVLGDLASIGYDAEWGVVSAASVGAPHRRDRIIIVAYSQSDGLRGRHINDSRKISEWPDLQVKAGRSSGFVANSDIRQTGRRLGSIPTNSEEIRRQVNNIRREKINAGRQWWATEPDVGRVAHGVPSRVDRLRGLGNAVVPQVAELIGRMVIDYDSNI